MTSGISNNNNRDIQPISPKPASIPSTEDPEFEILDKRLRHITNTIWPSTPYLLKLPTERAYCTSYHQEIDLLRGIPFNADEWQLQYMSFSAANWDDSLITPVGAWEDDKPDDIGGSPLSQKMQSAGGTPKVATKKISINEYRKRATDQSVANGTSKVNGETKTADTKHEEKPSSSRDGSLVPAQGKKELKRPAVERRPGEIGDSRARDTAQFSKNHRNLASKEPSLKDVGSNTKLSLPGPISPTLPPLFEKRLAEIDDLREDDPKKRKLNVPEKANAIGSKDGKSILGAKREAAKDNTLAQQSSSRKTGFLDANQVLEETMKILTDGSRDTGTTREGKPIKTEPSASSSGLSNQKIIPAKAMERQTENQTKPAKSHIVSLKIPRKIRKRYLAIIQLPPRRSHSSLSNKAVPGSSVKEGSESSTRDSQSTSIKEERDSSRIKVEKGGQGEGVKSLKTDPAGKSNEKNNRPDHDLDSIQPQNKRQKPAESRTQAFKSPILSGPASLKRARESTPSPAVKEETVSTPQGSIRNGTPAAPSSVERARHTPSASGSSHSTSAEAHDALRIERTKYFDLARSLKKESDGIYRAGDQAPSPSVMKKYLAIRLEVTLAFMLAYVIGDEMRRLARQPLEYDSTWATLFPWLRQLQQQTTDHPFLRGLSLQLEAVTHMVAWQIESDQAASNSASASSSSEKERTDPRALKRHYDEAQRMLIDGSCLLSVDDLQQEFPRTWRSKSRKPLAASPPKLTSTTLGGEFYLPITGITLPIEAVRAGKSLLGEWCKREGVDWAPKFNF